MCLCCVDQECSTTVSSLIFNRLPGVVSRGQQFKQGTQKFPLRPRLPAITGGSQDKTFVVDERSPRPLHVP